MAFQIELNEQELSIQGVQFQTKKEYTIMKNSLGSSMYEGFEPTKDMVQFLKDIHDGKKSRNDILTFVLGN